MGKIGKTVEEERRNHGRNKVRRNNNIKPKGEYKREQ